MIQQTPEADQFKQQLRESLLREPRNIRSIRIPKHSNVYTAGQLDDKVYFIESGNPETLNGAKSRARLAELLGKGSDIVALDVETGRERWRKSIDLKALDHIVYLTCAKDRLLVSGSRNSAKDKKIGAYSKGMRQRVKLAQAIAHDPELLILDEPLSGMDPMGRRATIRMIKDWAEQGRHIIVSSHILHEIESMTSTILLVNHGRIVAEGNVHEIRELIEDQPHRVFIQCDEPRRLANHLVTWPVVAGMKLDSGGVEVQTSKPDAFFTMLPEIVLSEKVRVTRLLSPDDNLQAVFEYLVK